MQKDEAYQKTFELLKAKQIYQACRIVAEYELSRPRPRGLLDDPWAYWRSYPDKDSLFILQVIFSQNPKILSFLKPQDLYTARVLAAQSFIWGQSKCYAYLKHDFNAPMCHDAVPRMLVFYAQTQKALNDCKALGIKYVRLESCASSCAVCQKQHGLVFEIDHAPELPHSDCIHEMGCRCDYLPVFEDEINDLTICKTPPPETGKWRSRLKKLIGK